MNREILFRGKRVDNGEWVKGRLLADDVIVPINQEFEIEGSCIFGCNLTAYEVDVETVGQYTGLTDRNGVKIFEGDIIKTKKYGKIIGYTNVNDFDIFKVIYEPCTFLLVNKNRGFNLVDDGFSKFEVIGNIHDNPELLEGEK